MRFYFCKQVFCRVLTVLCSVRRGPCCAGVLVGVPLVVGFSVARIFAEPFYEYALRFNPEVYSMTPREKVEGAKEVGGSACPWERWEGRTHLGYLPC